MTLPLSGNAHFNSEDRPRVLTGLSLVVLKIYSWVNSYPGLMNRFIEAYTTERTNTIIKCEFSVWYDFISWCQNSFCMHASHNLAMCILRSVDLMFAHWRCHLKHLISATKCKEEPYFASYPVFTSPDTQEDKTIFTCLQNQQTLNCF